MLPGHLPVSSAGGDLRAVVDARPSDAVTLALTAECPVYVDSDLLKDAGIEAPEADEEEVAQFRDFLDNVSAEDFETGEET